MDDVAILVLSILTLIILVGFLPVCAYTYYTYRIDQRKLEIQRILRILKITSEYREIHLRDIGCMHFSLAVIFTMIVTAGGLSTLLLADEFELYRSNSLLLAGMRMNEIDCGLKSECLRAYQQGALLVFGFGFLGAYIWGLQGIFRRYSVNDLLPITFYRFGLRMILSSLIALLIYHAIGGFGYPPGVENLSPTATPAPDTSGGGSATIATALVNMFGPTRDGILIVTAFLVGMFPQQGIRWLANKVSIIQQEGHPSVRNLPLSMIEGMTSYDAFRLEELGIDTCYDLANADFIPMLLKTSYGARELIDWILQAKLCVRFGDATTELRERGIRTITDLEGLEDSYLEKLATETTLMLPSLKHATETSVSDQNIERLKRAAELLSQYWEGDNPDDSQQG